MQDDSPPPPRAAPPLVAPFPPPLPADDVALSAARVESSVRGARQLAWWAIGLTAVGTLCCGGGAVAAMQALGAATDEQESELREAEQTAQMRKDTEVLLQTLADGLRATGDELPDALPEAPPRDAWATPVRYKRGATDATLTSAGRDKRFGTKDDVTIRLEAPK